MQIEIGADYLGLHLSSPILVGACAITRQPESVRDLAVAGAGAVVLPSLFQEQIEGQLEAPADSDDAAKNLEGYHGGPAAYLRTIHDLKNCVGIPIIANMNGFTKGRWLSFAREIQRAGADALELSFHGDCTDSAASTDEIEQRLVDCVEGVTERVSIPVSVKVAPYFTSLSKLAARLIEAGANGIVVFGQDPVWETRLDRLTATTQWPLTPSGNIHPTIAGLIRVRAGGGDFGIAASGGISGPNHVVQAVLAGADVVMVTSEIYRSGPDVVAHMVEGIRSYIARSGLASFQALLRARPSNADPLNQRMAQPETLDDRPKTDVDDYSGRAQST